MIRAAASRPYDVVVVGAGPAGSTAARLLASRGRRVLVVERMPLPRYKTCGGGLVARAADWLPLDLAFEPERRVHAAELHLPTEGMRFAVRRPEPVLLMTMRDRFDLALIRAAEQAGAEVCDGSAFRRLRQERNGLIVETTRGVFRARFLIGADGALSAVARHAGWREPAVGIPAIECELPVRDTDLQRFAESARFDVGWPVDGYAWIFPKRQHLSVGVLCMRRRPARLRNVLGEYLRRLGLNGVGEAQVHGFQIPLRPRAGGLARDRVLLVGDAAGLADPITAEGISSAIRSGRLAAEALLGADLDPPEVRDGYAARLEQELLPELRRAQWLSRLLYGLPTVRRALFQRCGQEFCEGLTEVILGRRSYRSLLADPANYARLLRRLAASPAAQGRCASP